MAAEKALGLAILFCDHIITEAESNKKTIVGIFNRVSSKTFPYIHPAMTVFVSVTNLSRKQSVQLRMGNYDESNELLRLNGEISAKNPMDVVEFVFDLRNIPFKEPGTYYCEFYVADELIFPRRFQVQKID